MATIKDAKDWMKEFRPALDAAMSCPDVSPMETVELYFEKIIEYERKTMAENFCIDCARLGKPQRVHHQMALWSHSSLLNQGSRTECRAWELWESWEHAAKKQEGEKAP